MNKLTATDIETFYLYPSAMAVYNRKVLVHTILGSCVAVCLYDKVLNIGGINHYMLPLWNGEGLSTPKYGNVAIDKLIDKMLANGSRKEHLVAKIFGGGESTRYLYLHRVQEENWAERSFSTPSQVKLCSVS